MLTAILPLWGSHLFNLSPATKPSPALNMGHSSGGEEVAFGNFLHVDYQEGDEHGEGWLGWTTTRNWPSQRACDHPSSLLVSSCKAPLQEKE